MFDDAENQSIANHPGAANTKSEPASLLEEIIRLILVRAVKDARDSVSKERRGITSYLLVSREYLSATLRMAYRVVYIRDRTTLALFSSSLTSNPKLAQLVRAINIAPPVTPFVHEQLIYLEEEYHGVPFHTSTVLRATAPYLKALSLLLPVHPTILDAITSQPYPRLRVLDTFHPFLLDERTRSKYLPILTQAYAETTIDEQVSDQEDLENAPTPQTEPSRPSPSWPNLTHLSIRIDGYAYRLLHTKIDLRRLSSVREIIVRPWAYERWEFNLVNFFLYLHIPFTVDVIALLWSPSAPPVHHGFKFLFHPKLIIPMQADPQTHTFDPALEFFNQLSFLTVACLTECSFWTQARRFVAEREMNPDIFLPDDEDVLVDYVEQQ
ncbi:hypothetical protein VNI00_017723 [Paramarasmius palmivorus]|uniref:Uncharacterized protein n=1 Tax=Paramarasmius palmivorus TaxID=297713 RepID=A0AAW0B3Q9_9AGAR